MGFAAMVLSFIFGIILIILGISLIRKPKKAGRHLDDRSGDRAGYSRSLARFAQIRHILIHK